MDFDDPYAPGADTGLQGLPPTGPPLTAAAVQRTAVPQQQRTSHSSNPHGSAYAWGAATSEIVSGRLTAGGEVCGWLHTAAEMSTMEVTPTPPQVAAHMPAAYVEPDPETMAPVESHFGPAAMMPVPLAAAPAESLDFVEDEVHQGPAAMMPVPISAAPEEQGVSQPQPSGGLSLPVFHNDGQDSAPSPTHGGPLVTLPGAYVEPPQQDPTQPLTHSGPIAMMPVPITATPDAEQPEEQHQGPAAMMPGTFPFPP